MVRIETITVGMFAMNCYLIYDDESGEGILIDPGGEAVRIIGIVDDHRLNVSMIINTHCHIDHVAETKTIQDHFGIPFYIHEAESALLNTLERQGEMFNMSVSGIPRVSGFLNDGDTCGSGNLTGRVLHTPGHSPGGISLLFGMHVFVGDCLFFDSIGRTDLYQGNYQQLINSIRTKLLVMDDDVQVYPGHGPVTTIGRERRSNPFLQ